MARALLPAYTLRHARRLLLLLLVLLVLLVLLLSPLLLSLSSSLSVCACIRASMCVLTHAQSHLPPVQGTTVSVGGVELMDSRLALRKRITLYNGSLHLPPLCWVSVREMPEAEVHVSKASKWLALSERQHPDCPDAPACSCTHA